MVEKFENTSFVVCSNNTDNGFDCDMGSTDLHKSKTIHTKNISIDKVRTILKNRSGTTIISVVPKKEASCILDNSNLECEE